MRFAKNTQHNTSKVLRLPRRMTMDPSKVLRLPRKLPRIFGKRRKMYYACHTKRLSTRYRTRLNVTKCNACHAKRSNETLETSKNDPSCRTYHRHGHTVLTRTVGNGCKRLRTVADRNATSSEHTLNPQSETGTLATHLGKKRKVQQEERERERERTRERKKGRKKEKKKERKKKGNTEWKKTEQTKERRTCVVWQA